MLGDGVQRDPVVRVVEVGWKFVAHLPVLLTHDLRVLPTLLDSRRLLTELGRLLLLVVTHDFDVPLLLIDLEQCVLLLLPLVCRILGLLPCVSPFLVQFLVLFTVGIRLLSC